MNSLKMLGLATVAAAALMVFAGTASADELCTTAANAENMCPAGKLIEKAEGSLVGTTDLETTQHEVLNTCTSGTMKITNLTPERGGGKANNKTGSESITGDITKEDLTWGSIGTNCTFPTATLKGGVIHFTHAAGGGTTVTATEAQVTINTVLYGSCVYGVGAGIDLGTVAQGSNTLVINAPVVKISGFICPESTVWHATYKVTNHSAVFYITN